VKILLVNQHYPPDAGATGKLAAQLAGRLVRRGHEITVVTGKPTYDEAKRAAAPSRETTDGVHVRRLPLLPRRSAPVARMLHYLSFAAALLARGPFLRRPDVVLAFSSTPLFGGVAAALLARLVRRPLVYVVQDVYPEVAVALGVLRRGPIERIALSLDTVAWRAAARVVVIGPELAAAAAARGVEPARTTVIANWADTRAIVPSVGSAFRRDAGIADDDFVVEYAGNFGRSQDLDVVLEAARLVEAEGPPARPVRFLLVGGGAREAELRRAARELSAVRVLPRQSEDKLGDVLAAADLSLVPLRRGLTRWCVPSKVYSILASGRPVGAAVDADSEVARLVEHGECGFRVEPGDARALAAEIRRLAGDADRARRLGSNGRVRAETEGSLDRAADEYEALLEAIVRSSGQHAVPTTGAEALARRPAGSGPRCGG
jgi:colanic acid biosynthesis glycosyl transferase WcaI